MNSDIYVYTLEFQYALLSLQMFVLKNEHSTKVPTTKSVTLLSHLSDILFFLKHILLESFFLFYLHFPFMGYN